ncbi:MAG: ABC transporter permease [Kiritimatiellia bacterium]|nr:ABC transporter permease [Kiritimatiellia bacterium]
MRKILALAILLCAASAYGEVKSWVSPAETDALVQELQEFLKGAEVRYPGSPGNLAMDEKINALFADSGLQRGEIKFQTACFIPGATLLSVTNQAPIRLYAMHPTLFRPGNFKEKEFTASLVYLGHGSNDDLEKIKGIPLEGALALMEFNCGTDWMRLLRFGVKGFIFIEPETYERNDALAKVFNTELAVPRFLVSRAEGALLKANGTQDARVNVKADPSRWENKMLRDLWVLIPGSDPDLSREIVVLVAPLDSNCIVPEMAFGAQAGANLFCLKKLLADFKRQPPARSVLLAAVNARVFANEGERMLAWHMLANEDEIERLRDTINGDLRASRVLIDYYSRLKLEGYDKAEEDLLVSWRSLADESTDKNITIKSPLVALAKRDINRLKNEQLILFQQNLPKREAERRNKEFGTKREKHVKVLTLFNKVGVRTKLSDLSKEEIRILKDYVQEVIRFNSVCAELNAQDLVTGRQNDAIREALKGNKAAFVICLGLDWASPQIGFSTGGPGAQWSKRWGANTFNIANELEEVRAGRENHLADTLTLRSGYGEAYYFKPNYAATVFQNAGQTAAFNLLNVFTTAGKAFLPSDTLAGLDKNNFAGEISFLLPYLRALFSVRNITDSSELDTSKIAVWSLPMSAVQIKTFKFDEYSASVVPELPVPDTAVIISRNSWGKDVYKLHLSDGVIVNEGVSSIIKLTDQRAATVIYGLTMNKFKSSIPNWAPAAFHYDRDFTAVDHVIDSGEVQNKMSSDDLYKDLTLALFECREFPIYPIADSSLISSSPIFIEYMIPLTAKGNTSPRKYGLTGVKSMLSKKAVGISAGAPAAFYLGKDEKTKFITERKRLALNATEKDYEGRGYASAAELGPDFFRNAVLDMSILNHARIKKMRDVANELVHEFAARGDHCIDAMKSASKEHDYLQYLRKLYEGLGAQVKSYEQAKQTSDDMLKASVVYMALLLPFCFFIEKLMFNFVKIEHEMGMFAVLFVVMFLVFRLIHPAFRLAQAAEAIFIAFVMGALGLFVISILRTRFEGEMQMLFRSYLSGVMDEAAFSAVTQKAMLIGVNNMKRRRIRTMLTTMTIVLIAFTMLSFTSISKKVNPTIVHKSSTPAYTGFMFSWPGKSQMDEATYAVMRDLFGAHGQVATRRWKVMSSKESNPFHVYFSNGSETTVDAVLGLTKAEDGFISKLPIVAGRYFSSDNAHEALISSRMAETLGLNPAKLEGMFVQCYGFDLNVVGVYDDDKIKNLKDLNNIPVLPIKRISQLVGQEDSPVEEELEDLGVLFFVDPLSLLIVPTDIVRRMGGFPYSVSVKMNADAPVWPLMDIILTSTMAKFYMGSLKPFSIGGSKEKAIAPGAYYIGSNYKTAVGGLAALLIPLFISATIILNTMLGSVYERKKEIAVYNAIGLNPHHIGLFFLAESFVYGVIGSVGGYLIGQLLSLGVNYTGLVKGINFNYSSLSVAYVIIFTIVIVLLSTIYPAMAAVRTAVPSGKRNWSMPAHKGNIMEIVFPFIYQPKIASGVLAYLREYFANFTEVSVGDLIANQLACGCKKDDKGRKRFNLDYHIALVPYDLGVTENLRFDLAYDDYVQAYRLVMKIERVSGQDVNWITTNRPFLERLRKYLMRWRNLDLGQQTFYVQQSSEAISRGS